MAEIHGDGCDCCKDLSPIAKKTLIQLQSILSGLEGAPGLGTSTPKEDILKELAIVNSQLLRLGGIADIQKLAERFFEVDFNSIVPSRYPLNKEDENVVVAKNTSLTAKDITDNPTIDVTKIVNLQGLNFRKFKSLKLSVTVPTINVVKNLKIGPLSISVSFSISLFSVEWGLTPSADYNSPGKAIRELKKYTVKAPLRPSEGRPLNELKTLANEQLKDSNRSLNQELQASQTSNEFFLRLTKNKMDLDVETNIGDAMEAILKEKAKSLAIIKKQDVEQVGDKLLETADDLSKIDLCGPRITRPPKFDEDEIVEAVPCAIKKEREKPVEAEVSRQFAEINDLLSQLPTESTQNQAIKDVEDFVSGLDKFNKQMSECATSKTDLTNDWYLFYEEYVYHRITKKYFNNLYEQSKNVRLEIVRILKKRDVATNELVDINEKLTSAYTELFSYKENTSDEAIAQPFIDVFKVLGTATTTPVDDLYKDPTGGAQTIEELVGVTYDPAEILLTKDKLSSLIVDKLLLQEPTKYATLKAVLLLARSGSAADRVRLKKLSPILEKLWFETGFYEGIKNKQDEFVNKVNDIINRRNIIIGNLVVLGEVYTAFRNIALGGATDVNTEIKNIRDEINVNIRKLTNRLGYTKNETPPDSPLLSVYQLQHPSKVKIVEKKEIVENTEVTKYESVELPDFDNKIKDLWKKSVDKTSKQFSTGVNIQGVNPPIDDYVKLIQAKPNTNPVELDLPTPAGSFYNHVWGPFYSKDRIDNYFFYYEQGFNKPKPQPKPGGNPEESVVQKTITNGNGDPINISVPSSFDGLGINLTQAEGHLENFELFLRKKVIYRVAEVENSDTYKTAIAKIEELSTREAKLLFFLRNPVTINFLGNPISNYNKFDDIARNSFVVDEYYKRLRAELRVIDVKRRKAQECVDEQQKKIEDSAKSFAAKFGGDTTGPVGPTGGTGIVLGKNGVGYNGINDTPAGPAPIDNAPEKIITAGSGTMVTTLDNVTNLKEATDVTPSGSESIQSKCKKLLGSDPVGNKMPSANCPNYTKNCWWREFTKHLQLVSLMPIPELDPLNFSQRLFRYYPVPLIIPIAPLVAPSLTLPPIPQPLVAIPLPFLWKHIITIQTPLGLFVIWVALAGGFMPNVFIMLIDEKMQSSFIVTLKGPTPIPARQMAQIPIENQSLFDLVPGLNSLFRVDLKSLLGKLLVGSSRLDATNPDAPKTVIDNIKSKIKKSIDDLDIPDPSFAGDSDRAKEIKKKIKKAFDVASPDLTGFDEALTEVLSLANDAVDKIKLSPIKIPKNAKGLILEPPSAIAMIETMSTLIDSALNAPAAAAQKVLGDIGAAVKTIDVKEKVNNLVRTEVDKPDVQQFFIDIDNEIAEMEAGLTPNPQTQEEIIQAVNERTKKIKKLVLKPLEKVASKITPEVLGFVSIAAATLPLPFPCYSNLSLNPVPPYIALAIIAIKQIPSLISAIPDASIGDLVAKAINLNLPLPDAKTIFQTAINDILSVVPSLVLPVSMNQDLLKLIAQSLKNFLVSFKLRLPKPGLPVQLVIPPSLIKTAIKGAISVFLTALKSIIMIEVNKILTAAGPDKASKVLAIIAIIKVLLGVELEKITGKDVKAFLVGILERVAYPPLDIVKNIITIATAVSSDFISIMKLFTLPDPTQFPPIKKEGPFIEVNTKQIQQFVDPLLKVIVPAIFETLPWPVTLLGASFPITRIALSKIHPVKPIDKLPSWEGLTLKNMPYVLFLDQIAATAQRASLLWSNYYPPGFIPLTP